MSDRQRYPLKELARFQRGITWSKEQEVNAWEPGTVPVLRIPNVQENLNILNLVYLKGVNEEKIQKYAAAKDWILMVGSNGNPTRVGNCVFIKEKNEFLFASFLIGIKPIKPDLVIPDFLFLLFRGQEIQRFISDDVQGSTGLNNINLSRLKSKIVEFPLVQSQRKIVKILSAMEEAIEQTEALIAKYQKIKDGIMRDLFTRGVTTNGKLRPTYSQAPSLYKQSRLGWIPKEWEEKCLTEIVAFPFGQVDPKLDQFSDWILVAPDHIEKETGRLLKKETAKAQGAISGKYTFASGDIVYSKIRPYLRKAILADFEGLCSADMYPLRPIKGTDSYFLFGLILGERFSKFAESVSMRSGFPKINRNEISEYTCAVPPKAEQITLGKILFTNYAFLSSLEVELDKLRQQKLGIMHDLLTGQMQVKLSELRV
jgi:type I restriction enzyme S subunit